MPGVEQPQLEVVLQHVVDGLPVHPGGLHMPTRARPRRRPQPVPLRFQEPSRRGLELPRLPIGFFALAGGDPKAGADGGFMHVVETCAPLDHPLQNPSPSRSQGTSFRVTSPKGASYRFVESSVRALIIGNDSGCPRGSRVTLMYGLQAAPVPSRRRFGNDYTSSFSWLRGGPARRAMRHLFFSATNPYIGAVARWGSSRR